MSEASFGLGGKCHNSVSSHIIFHLWKSWHKKSKKSVVGFFCHLKKNWSMTLSPIRVRTFVSLNMNVKGQMFISFRIMNLPREQFQELDYLQCVVFLNKYEGLWTAVHFLFFPPSLFEPMENMQRRAGWKPVFTPSKLGKNGSDPIHTL